VGGPARVDGEYVVSAEEYAAIFAALPTAYLVMSPDLTIVDANPAYLALLGRTRDELVGRYVFDAFPPAPETLDDAGANPLQLSFERARDTGMPDLMPLFRYEVLDQATGRPVTRAWSLISSPVPGADGRTQLVLQRVEDVSEYLAERERLAESRDDGSWARLDLLEADLFARTQELQAVVASREAATSRLAAMAQVVLRLAAAETVEDITGILADAGLAAIGADGGAIAVRDGAEGIVHLTMTPSLGASAQRRYSSIPLGSRLPAAWVARTGETVVIENQAQAEAWSAEMVEGFRRTPHRSWIAVPLSVGGRVLGSLLAGWTVERSFTADEVELVQAFASQCALALDRIESLALERRSAERSRLLAEQLQRSMLSEPVQPEHCRIAVRYLPATDAGQVGGDWYDAFEQADGAVNLVIGDVVGHDIAAAATMGQLRSLLRGIAVAGGPGPAQVLDTLDAAIAQLGLETYATVGIGRLERTDDEAARGGTRLRWASAGHPAPVVLDGLGGLVAVPDTAGRLMLGVDRTRTRGEIVVEMPEGATVLLYTDGLVERPGSDLDEGVGRLNRLAAELVHLPLDELCDQLLDRLVDGRPSDDVALVAVRHEWARA
jgi:PAS domain S-box-containing protein